MDSRTYKYLVLSLIGAAILFSVLYGLRIEPKRLPQQSDIQVQTLTGDRDKRDDDSSDDQVDWITGTPAAKSRNLEVPEECIQNMLLGKIDTCPDTDSAIEDANKKIQTTAQMAALKSLYSFNLVVAGEAEMMNGSVLYSTGTVVAIGDGGAYSPLQEEPVTDIPNGVTVVSPDQCPRYGNAYERSSLLESGETAVAITHGPLGNLQKATIILVRGQPASDLFGYAPLHLRIFSGQHLLINIDLGADRYPCTVILDDFDSMPGNEVAVGWLSVGAKYTAGVTLFRVQSN